MWLSCRPFFGIKGMKHVLLPSRHKGCYVLQVWDEWFRLSQRSLFKKLERNTLSYILQEDQYKTTVVFSWRKHLNPFLILVLCSNWKDGGWDPQSAAGKATHSSSAKSASDENHHENAKIVLASQKKTHSHSWDCGILCLFASWRTAYYYVQEVLHNVSAAEQANRENDSLFCKPRWQAESNRSDRIGYCREKPCFVGIYFICGQRYSPRHAKF